MSYAIEKPYSIARRSVLAVWLVAGMAVLSWPAPATAQTLTVLHAFSGYPDGGNPEGGLILDSSGNNLYGTTWDGGLSNDFCSERGEYYGCGTLFRLTRHGSSWIFSLLYQFIGPDGAYQNQPVTIAPNNTIYGPSQEGGSCIFFSYGCGTIFNMAPGPTLPKSVLTPWIQSGLYKFAGLGQGGPAPSAVVLGPDGKLYGTTSTGLHDYGDIFQLSRSGNSWTENILYDFTDQLDGSSPTSLVSDGAGNYFGVTSEGGNTGCGSNRGCGTIFEISPSGSGWTKTTLHVFNAATDGGYPGAPIRDAAGNLYGIANAAGYGGPGNVWELSPSNGGWSFKVLYWFSTSIYPGTSTGLTMDAAGNLYGASVYNGAYNYGFLFKLTNSNGNWTFTDLYDFTGGDDGCNPWGPVAVDSAGSIYVGTNNCNVRGGGGIVELTQ